MTKVAIIGFGAIGEAIRKLLAGKNAQIEAWDKEPARCTTDKSLAETVVGSEILFLGVPSFALREALDNIKPCLSAGTIVISLTKGLEQGTGKCSEEIMREVLGGHLLWAILGGPMLSKEIMEGKETFATFASDSIEIFKKVKELFHGTKLTLEYSSDARGVSLAGVLKNIYALSFGVIAELGAGYNLRGELTRRSLEEISEIIGLLGGRKESVMSAAGISDFVATALSPLSRNFQAGEELVKTGKYCLMPEGIVSLPLLMRRLAEHSRKFNLLNSINQVFCGKAQPGIIPAVLKVEEK